MAKYTETFESDKILYYKYVLSELSKYDSSGTRLVTEKLMEMDSSSISNKNNREIERYVEFLMITENIEIYDYRLWYRFIKIFN